MITFREKGDFSKITKYLERSSKSQRITILEKYGDLGVSALSSATPKLTGKTASSWHYKITEQDGVSKLSFYNSNINNGYVVAILLQYGHGTRNGGYTQGLDYINPALAPVFDKLAEEAWKEIVRV